MNPERESHEYLPDRFSSGMADGLAVAFRGGPGLPTLLTTEDTEDTDWFYLLIIHDGGSSTPVRKNWSSPIPIISRNRSTAAMFRGQRRE